MDQQLMLGVLLIVVGIALGLIAAAVVVNRRIDAREANEAGGDAAGEMKAAEARDDTGGEVEVPEPTRDPDALESANDSDPVADDPLKETAEATEAAEVSEAAGPEAAGAENEPSEGSTMDQPAAEPAAGPAADSLLGELHRDPVTGALLIKSGGREFRSASDINDRAQRERLAGAAAELSAWFEQSSSVAGQSAATGMVQAIDQILQRSLEQLDSSSRGVRLIQDISGGVKVLIGVKSYEVDEVPDDEIRRLIRQAVAEWEAQQ